MRAIGLVLNPAYGARLASLADRMHVWAMESPDNRAAAEVVWPKYRPGTIGRGVTLFARADEMGEPQWSGLLGMIDLHHGPHAEDPPYEAVEVLGYPLTDDLRRWLKASGFGASFPTTVGFRAERVPDS